jgi:hypothetical protein
MAGAWRRGTVGVVAAAAVVLGGGGCIDPSAVPRQSALERLDVTIEIGSDRTVQVRTTATFVDDEGGLVAVPTGFGSSTPSGAALDGSPIGRVSGSLFAATDVRIRARTGTLTYAVDGAVDVWSDLTEVAIPIHAAAEDASRQDPLVGYRATIALPPGNDPDDAVVSWGGGLDQVIAVDGDTIVLEGNVAAWSRSDLLVGFTPGLAGSSGVDQGRDRPRRAAFDAEVASRAASTASTEEILDEQARDAALTRPLFLGVAVGIVLLMFLSAQRGKLRERRRLAALVDDVPGEVRTPPALDPPAVVALLVAKGERISRGGLAGSILRLVEQRVLELEGITSEEFVLRIAEPRPVLAGADALLLDAVAAAVAQRGDGGSLQGPPIWTEGPRRFWTPYRRAVLKEARAAGLLTRTHSPMMFLFYGVVFAFCTWPLWLDESLVLLVPVIGVASVICVFPFVAKLSMTDKGIRRRSEWLAFRRFLREEGQLEHVGAPGTAVWGSFLSYGAALGVAPTATDALVPPDADGDVRVRADAT